MRHFVSYLSHSSSNEGCYAALTLMLLLDVLQADQVSESRGGPTEHTLVAYKELADGLILAVLSPFPIPTEFC